jgi:hypothetical protein
VTDSKGKNEGARMHYRVTTKDGTLQVKESSSRKIERGLWGLKEITKMDAAKVKRKESSSQNRRQGERRKID